jgi:CubicO group peptidase (beta-lactamase class C family)
VPASLPWAQPACGIDGRGVYGYNWWVNGTLAAGRRKWPAAPGGTFAATGFHNNKCFVIPEWEMVIVRLGLDPNVPDEVWDGFFGLLAGSVETDAQTPLDPWPAAGGPARS